MTEENRAVEIIRDLQKSLETSYRYSSAGTKFPQVFLMILYGILGVGVISLAANYYNYVVVSAFPGGVEIATGSYINLDVIWTLYLAVVSILVYRMLKKAFLEGKGANWEEFLKEGAVGILRIVENTDWEDVLTILRKAKVVFVVLSVLEFTVALGLAYVILFFVGDLLMGEIFSTPISLYTILGVSLTVIIGLGDKAISRSYSELWHMDSLVAELRWFYLEFRGTQF